MRTPAGTSGLPARVSVNCVRANVFACACHGEVFPAISIKRVWKARGWPLSFASSLHLTVCETNEMVTKPTTASTPVTTTPNTTIETFDRPLDLGTLLRFRLQPSTHRPNPHSAVGRPLTANATSNRLHVRLVVVGFRDDSHTSDASSTATECLVEGLCPGAIGIANHFNNEIATSDVIAGRRQ